MRVALGLVIVSLAGCSAHRDSAEAELRDTRQLMRAEQYDIALPKAASGIAKAERNNNALLAWRFRNLEAEILLGQRQARKAMALLDREPPEDPEWAEIQGRTLLLKGQAAYLLSDYPH